MHTVRWSRIIASILIILFISISAFKAPVALADGGGWSSIGPEGATIYDLVIDPGEPDKVFAATSGGLYQTTDGGGSWEQIGECGFNSGPYSLALDPLSPNTIYAGCRGRIIKSDNGGADWEVYSITSGWDSFDDRVMDIVIDPVSTHILYAAIDHNWGEGGGVYKSIDGGMTWQKSGLAWISHINKPNKEIGEG